VKFHKGKKPRKQKSPRTHRTRKDPFEDAWTKVRGRLELDPTKTANDLILELIAEEGLLRAGFCPERGAKYYAMLANKIGDDLA
jgi:hypothetical protein